MPATITAGDTMKFTLSPADYPASEGWALALHVAGVQSLSWDTGWIADDGASTYTITVPAASTVTLPAGDYRWTIKATLSDETYTVETGTLTVLADPSAAEDGDLQAFAEEMLGKVEDEIRARLTGDGSGHSSYSIGGRSLSKYDLSELYALRSKFKGEVLRTRSGGFGPLVKVRFGCAS